MLKDLTIYFLTWNVAGQPPTEDLYLSLGLNTPESTNPSTSNPKGDENPSSPDIYAIGLQEVSVKPQNLIYDFLFDDPWIDNFKTLLGKLNYIKVRQVRLQGIVLIVFCKRHLLTNLRNIQTTYTRTGFGGTWGNKGGVTLRMSVNGCSMSITTCHLAAHDEELEQRIQEYNTIIDKQKFVDPETATILAHDYVFWFGDLNFRINHLTSFEILNHIQINTLSALFDHDQLKQVMNNGEAFSEFRETEPKFRPTFKYMFHKQNYNVEVRKPAWTDRVLFRLTPNAYENVTLQLDQLHYTSHDSYMLSDHKPVSSLFNVKVFDNPNLVNVEFYPTQPWKVNRDGEAWYRMSVNHKPNAWDWVGLFRAGFMGVEEHLHYVWANTIPTDQHPTFQQENEQSSFLDLNEGPNLLECESLVIEEWGPWYRVMFVDQALLVPGIYRLLYIRGRFNDVLGMSSPFPIR